MPKSDYSAVGYTVTAITGKTNCFKNRSFEFITVWLCVKCKYQITYAIIL